jgi:hypothetical protein
MKEHIPLERAQTSLDVIVVPLEYADLPIDTEGFFVSSR